MLKETVNYVDFDGNEVTEELYFNLNTVEMTRANAKFGGDLEAHINKVVDKKDMEGIMEVIEYLVLYSYGLRSEDGRRFIKTKEVREEFEYSIAYAEIFEKLLLNPSHASTFAKGLVTTPNLEAKKLKMIEEQKAKSKVDGTAE